MCQVTCTRNNIYIYKYIHIYIDTYIYIQIYRVNDSWEVVIHDSHISDVTHSYVTKLVHMSKSQRIWHLCGQETRYVWVMTHAYLTWKMCHVTCTRLNLYTYIQICMYMYIYVYIYKYIGSMTREKGSYCISVMTHSYAWHDSFARVTWLIHMCDMTLSYVWHDSFTRDMTRPHVNNFFFFRIDVHVWHQSFIYDMTFPYVTCSIHTLQVTWHIHSCVTCLTHMSHAAFLA